MGREHRFIGRPGWILSLALACFLPCLGSGPARAQDGAADSDPAPSAVAQVRLVPVVTGLVSPTYVTHAGDGSGRLFVLEQDGRVLVLQPGASTPTLFLDLRGKVLSGGERGLLGLAFHPKFERNHRFYVDYTRRSDGATVIARYRASTLDPNIARTGASTILTIAQPFANHNGGMIEFGQDGFLYIAMGDGGSGNDPGDRAQNVEELLGKILRIDVNRRARPLRYSSPSTNPFFGATPGRDEIYALGLRNPWRFSFDRVNGRLFAADVGQASREEVDLVTLGGNYGWRVFEGTRCTNLDPPDCARGDLIPPIVDYGHTLGRCSITGGYVYRGSQGALPLGTYVFGDLCTGEIFALANGQMSVLLDTNLALASFGEDEAGEIYAVDITGSIHRIVGP